MRSKILTIFVLLLSLVITKDVLSAEWPIPSLKKHPSDPVSMQKAINKSTAARASFFSWVWNTIGSSSCTDIDDLSYLFALAIDLYNSLPPDAAPPWPENPQGELVELEFEPYKYQFLFKMSRFNINRPARSLMQKKKKWEWRKKRYKDNPSRMKKSIKYNYITDYIEEKVRSGEIKLDANNAPASISLEALDILRPTHYLKIKEYMFKSKSAIESGVPPWESNESHNKAVK